ncbi:MAG: NADH-quinone oxidoreductase subunit L [Anaerolineae bacterium]|nr:NADH-quinone oxidoreductase subunit L [Anaerolineae bacterium]
MVVLALFFPLLGIALNLTLARRWREPAAGIIASAAVGGAFVVSLVQLASMTDAQTVTVTLARWLRVGSFSMDWALQIDALSLTMMLVVTGIGTLIHIYAIGYMHGDPRFSRFFIYLNLFIAAMLVLVTANNYLMLFAGWEGVGLCSFLLIGFWFDKTGEGAQISSAARKAFIVNRIGDAGLLLGLFLMATTFGSLDFAAVFDGARTMFAAGSTLMTALTLLLFVGVTGKSAQIPLYVWLPDAMVGPTPVSALIHAATMVTAGIYLIVRSHVLFDLAPLTQTVVVVVGTATALLAATVAVSQFDIKRVLAYSTISQLGFMVAAVGMGAYAAGMFHLVTHAFFKALLFLAAGSILHALGTQDSRQMGALSRRMRTTFAVYLVGGLALAGVPPFAGFFSKDEILAAAYDRSPLLYLALAAAAFMTAFYITRQVCLIFLGEPRSDAADHAHESAPLLTRPLIVLALLAAVGGALNLPGVASLHHWLANVTGETEAEVFHLPVAALSTLVALAGIGLAYWLYRKYRADDPLAGRLFTASLQGWRIDELYAALVIQPFKRVTAWFAAADNRLFYGLDDAAVRLSQSAGDRLRKTQTGQLNWNVAWTVGGLIVVLLVVILGRGV